jgi:hypothetical protein
MKKINLMLAVLSILAIVAFTGPAIAQNWEVETQTHTVGSKFFGFAPTTSNISTFMDMNLALSNADGTLWTSDDYIRGTLLPGAWTSRADRSVSTSPDWGCGVFTVAGGNCVELGATGMNLPDRVLTDGFNTAPTAVNSTGTTFPGGGGTGSGVLVGDMISFVSLDDIDADMPFGTIQFTRSTDLFFTVYQNISHTLAGLYTWNETDFNSTPIPVFTLGRNLGFGSGEPNVAGDGIRAIMNLTQTGMGGLYGTFLTDCSANQTGIQDCGTSVLNNDVVWTGGQNHPGGGNFFTPGLNIANWAGNAPTVDSDGFR